MSRVSQVWNFYRRGRGQWVETDPVDSILCASGTALKVSQRSTQNCRSMKFLPPNKIDKKGVFFFFLAGALAQNRLEIGTGLYVSQFLLAGYT